MMRKNAAEEIAQKLCESVAASLRGQLWRRLPEEKLRVLMGIAPGAPEFNCVGHTMPWEQAREQTQQGNQTNFTVEQLKDLKSALRAFEEVLTKQEGHAKKSCVDMYDVVPLKSKSGSHTPIL